MLEPTPERFRALARSSPWRWASLRFGVSWVSQAGSPTWPSPVRAWVRRPSELRVEELDGTVVRPSRYLPPEQPAPQVASRRASAPALDRDGFVAQRPPDNDVECGDPFFQDYRWVAMLDPVELADGDGHWSRDPAVAPVEFIELRAVEHAGRACWEAVLRPTAAYDPRCGCCPLLFSARSDEVEAEAGAAISVERLSSFDYADAHRVGLDVQTGVCVLTEELGGAHSGDGHRMHNEAVDEPMTDSLFDLER